MNKALGSCPICGKEMKVTRLECDYCLSALEGSFSLCKFCGLSPDQLRFVEVFLRSRGNIKEVERAFGISYPTVRNRLDEVIRALGYKVDEGRDSLQEKRKEILDSLESGEINADEASKLLKRL